MKLSKRAGALSGRMWVAIVSRVSPYRLKEPRGGARVALGARRRGCSLSTPKLRIICVC
jgi:hypothetical protein